jgi:hypothetical protein
MKCFICKENIKSITYKSCDRECCSKECQIFLVKLNLRIDPNLKYPELWVKSYNEDVSNVYNAFGDKDQRKDRLKDKLKDRLKENDNDGIELNISETGPNKKKKQMERESSIIIYKRSIFCCSH